MKVSTAQPVPGDLVEVGGGILWYFADFDALAVRPTDAPFLKAYPTRLAQLWAVSPVGIVPQGKGPSDPYYGITAVLIQHCTDDPLFSHLLVLHPDHGVIVGRERHGGLQLWKVKG